MGCISVKNEVSPKRNENRKKLHTVFPRHLIFKYLQEVLKFNICVSWSSSRTDLGGKSFELGKSKFYSTGHIRPSLTYEAI